MFSGVVIVGIFSCRDSWNLVFVSRVVAGQYFVAFGDINVTLCDVVQNSSVVTVCSENIFTLCDVILDAFVILDAVVILDAMVILDTVFILD